MLKDLFRLLMISSILLCVDNSLGRQMKSSGAHELIEDSQGTYAITQLGREIGREKFSRKIFADNMLVLETSMELSLTGKDTLHENIQMILDEDSYFPRSYASIKKVGGLKQEVSIEMFANVALIKRNSTKEGESRADSRVRKVVVSTGSLFLQQGVASQLALLMKRYNDARRGTQNLLIFDPISARESSILVSYSSSIDTLIAGTKEKVDIYRVNKPGMGSVRLYVGKESKIIRAFDAFQKMEFVLTDFALLKH